MEMGLFFISNVARVGSSLVQDRAGYCKQTRIRLVEGYAGLQSRNHSLGVALGTIKPKVAQSILNGANFVFGGSGNGEAMVANKVKGVRCAYVWNSQTAELGRRHNDANCIAFGQRMISEYIALECVKIFMTTEFEGGRHIERIREIE